MPNVWERESVWERVRRSAAWLTKAAQLQALRDLYLVYKAIEQEHVGIGDLDENANLSPGFFWVMRDFLCQFKQLFQQRRLANAMISTSTVNLAQQLCGGEFSRMRCAAAWGEGLTARNSQRVCLLLRYVLAVTVILSNAVGWRALMSCRNAIQPRQLVGAHHCEHGIQSRLWSVPAHGPRGAGQR